LSEQDEKKKTRKSHAKNTTRISRTQPTADRQLTFAGKNTTTTGTRRDDVAYIR